MATRNLPNEITERTQSLLGIAGSGTVWVPGQTTGSASLSGLYQTVNLIPFYVPEAVTIASVSVNVTTLGTGGLRLGCYAHNPSTGYPTGAPLWDAGTVSLTGTGIKTATVSYTFAPGWYHQAWCWQTDGTTPAVLTGGGTTSSPSGTFAARLSTNAAFTGNGFYHSGTVTGALPTIGTVLSQSLAWVRFTFTNA